MNQNEVRNKLELAAEIVAEAMLGPAETEGSWLLLSVDTSRYREPVQLQRIAEEILDELRNCPPAPGFEGVEIPGEGEREYREKTIDDGIALPRKTLEQIQTLSVRLGNR
ncbi:MAG: Ldh family oxidoreductase [Gammaproteobacteria bacterium]|nr:Ldh family oxidoreductase [Gammaproteobacteria bacterium]